MTPLLGTLRVFDSAADLAREGAEWLRQRACASAERFVLCLSGGSTPKPLYEHLAQDPIRTGFPWARTHVVFGDERFVPQADPASNFGMANRAFLAHVAIPAANIHPVPTEDLTLEDSAARYEATLKALHGGQGLDAGRPLFDVTLLGLGDDGHTASLIPGEPVLDERTRWVAAVGHGRPEPRITLTYPALESSHTVVFLVSGEAKRGILDNILSGGSTVPAARLKPAGEVLWFADRAAAGRWTGA